MPLGYASFQAWLLFSPVSHKPTASSALCICSHPIGRLLSLDASRHNSSFAPLWLTHCSCGYLGSVRLSRLTASIILRTPRVLPIRKLIYSLTDCGHRPSTVAFSTRSTRLSNSLWLTHKKNGAKAPNCLELRIAGSMKKINYI